MSTYQNNKPFLNQKTITPEMLIQSLDSLVRITECSRPKGTLDHVGLKLEYSDAKVVYMHTNPQNGRHISTKEEFAPLGNLREQKIHQPTAAIKTRLKNCLATPKRYSVFDNCQHLVSHILTGFPSSRQLAGGVGGAAIAGTIAKVCGATPFGIFVSIFVGGVVGTAVTKR